MTSIDLAPVIADAAGVVVSVATAVAAVALHSLNGWLAAKTGHTNLLNEQVIKDNLHTALENGVSYAVAQVGKTDWHDVAVKNALVAQAVQYAIQHVPDAIEHFKLDEPDLEKLATAKLATIVLPPAVVNVSNSVGSAVGTVVNAIDKAHA